MKRAEPGWILPDSHKILGKGFENFQRICVLANSHVVENSNDYPKLIIGHGEHG
jgi:hypothetical protein